MLQRAQQGFEWIIVSQVLSNDSKIGMSSDFSRDLLSL
jgi:hypothetical protein